MASPTQSSAVAPSFPPDDLHPAELGQPLRRKYGRMIPLCSACGRQWLLAPMWGMNLVTLALVLVPGWLWFVKVAPERSSFEQFILAPALFLGTLTAYALTSWVDPGIVQPGRFAALEARLRQAAVSARSDGGEALAFYSFLGGVFLLLMYVMITWSLFSVHESGFSSLDQLQTALRSTGLESSNLIIGIDFTKSNEWTGKRTFGGRSLHDTSISTNPYSSVINIIGTLEGFDDDALIPVYGFGSADTGADKLFSFNPGEAPCHGFEHVMQRYMSLAPHVRLAGPTTFAPIIRKAIEIVSQSGGQYHILVIIADGQVTRPSSTADGQLSSFEQDTVNAIVEAANFPLSIVLVGVGDGPWDLMDHFDDAIPHRRFDNWQSVVAQFALDALMEVPDQYRFINQLGLMGRSQQPRHAPIHIVPPAD
ncbi:RGLG2, partial [Symbiodinium sp. KB8]